MSRRRGFFLTAAALVAAAVLTLASPVQAGGGPTLRTPGPTIQYVSVPPAVPVFVPTPTRVTISVKEAPRSAAEPYFVNIRGPEGQVRRFEVEGGPTAIQPPQVIVLRPGQSVQIRWVAGR